MEQIVSFSISKRRAVFAFVAALSAALLSGCSKLGNGVDFNFSPKIIDFAKSQIITNGPQAADGTSALLVVVQLTNSDSSPVVGFTPVYRVVTGTGVTTSPCTASNIYGVSTCILRAVQAGTKQIAVTNITITLQADVVFTTPTGGKSTLEVASSSKKQTQGGYTFAGMVGTVEHGIKKTSGTYSFFGSVQGEEFSR